MKGLASINWQRWVATLCVALIALVTIERSFGPDAWAPKLDPVYYSVTDVAALGSEADPANEQQAPAQTHQGHCCAAHIAGLPAIQYTNFTMQSSVSVFSPMFGVSPASRAQDGEHRPPRALVIV